MLKNVLVAGGAGYIGSHTVKVMLDKGFNIVVLDNLSTGNLQSIDPEIKFYQGDIADRGLVTSILQREHIEAVVHFAACSIVSDSMKHPDRYFNENVAKLNRFIATLINYNVDKIVFSSTAATYGIPQIVPIPETSSLKPINPYGASKLMMEQMLSWMEISYGLKWIALRYFNAAGAMPDGSIGEDHKVETHLIPLVLKAVLDQKIELQVYGNDYDTPDGTCIRDYIHVLDLADAHIAALNFLDKSEQNGVCSGAYNVGTGVGYSVKEIIETAEMITGKKVKYEEVRRRQGDPSCLVAKVDKIKIDLGWQARYSQLDNIISNAWEWHSRNPDGYRNS